MDETKEILLDSEANDKEINEKDAAEMSKKNNKDKKSEKDIETDYLKKSEARDNLFIAVTAVMAGVFFIFIIYQIVTSPNQLIPLLACGAAFIVDIFLMIFSVLRKFEVQRLIEKSHFDEMFAAQKASYFVLRRSFDNLEERLNSLENGGSSSSGDDIISAQKALTKVTINKNADNIKELSVEQRKLFNNAKDEALQSNQEQRKLINDARDEVLQSDQEQRKHINEARDEMLQSNQELKYLLSDMSTELKSLKADIQQLELRHKSIKTTNYRIEEPEVEIKAEEPVEDTETVIPEEEIKAEESVQEPETTEHVEDSKIAEPVGESEVPKPVEDTETILPEEEIKAEDSVQEPEISEPEEEIIAEKSVQEPETTEHVEDSKIAEPVGEPETPKPVEETETVASEEEIKAEEPVQEPEISEPEEEMKAEEPAEKTPDPSVDLSDPNRALSPDEIAKLFASMT